MALSFEEVLTALCSQVKHTLSNDSQTVYLVGDQKEARLACDVLAAHGFDAKLYDADNPPAEHFTSKIYITKPSADDANVPQKVASAVAYARSLRPIKQELDALYASNASPDFQGYTVAFGNIPGGASKQIIIQVLPAGTLVPAHAAAPSPPPVGTPQPASHSKLPGKKPPSGIKASKEEEFMSGPALTQKTYPSKIKQKAGEEDSLYRQLYLYVTGNSATAGFFLLMAFIVPAVIIYSLLVMSKTFLCPDIAVEKSKKNNAWYCHVGESTKEEEERNNTKILNDH